ncbi:MAG TPA: twin-arginine translocase TatA/TatE family subunit [Dehalococcoidia bacterium]
MPDIGVPELLIVAFIVVLLFGPAKAADLGGALGRGIREFRKASTDDSTDDAPASAPTGAVQAADSCPHCSGKIAPAQKFCTLCGGSLARTA